MLFAAIISTLGLALSLPVEAAALPRGRRSAAHNRFILVRSPQISTENSQNTVMTTAADVIDLSNSTILNTTAPNGQDAEDGFLTPLASNETTTINNSTGYNTVPPQLNDTDPVVSNLISSLAASATAYSTFSYSAYVPTATSDTPATSVTDAPTPAWEQPADPVDQALQAAQSYAMQQAIGQYMPTVTVELVMVPTQEPDGTWDYVVHIGNDGTATAVPTFSASPVQSPGTPISVIQPSLQVEPTGASPYIHTPAVQPAPVATESSAPVNWSEDGSEATGVAAYPTPWTPPSPSATSYYVGQGYVSAISSEGRGAVTFAYSTTAVEPAPSASEPVAWTSGKGQQHAYPWMTASQQPAATPAVTPEPSAWTSGRGQQHAYPWMSASDQQAAVPTTTEAWISGHGQQHAYPWNTEAPSATAMTHGTASATTDAKGVVVATLIPMTSAQGEHSSALEQTVNNPWLVSATQTTPEPSQPSDIETAADLQSVFESDANAPATESPSPDPTSVASEWPQAYTQQVTATDPLATYPALSAATSFGPEPTAIQSAQATATESEPGQDEADWTASASETRNPSSTLSSLYPDPIITAVSTNEPLASAGPVASAAGESIDQPEPTETQSQVVGASNPSVTETAMNGSALPPLATSTFSGTYSAVVTADSVAHSSSESYSDPVTGSTSAIMSVETSATETLESHASQSTEGSASSTMVVTDTPSLGPSETSSSTVEASEVTPSVTSALIASATSEAESSSGTSSTTDSDILTSSLFDDGNGIATETFTAWTTLDVTETSTAGFASETESLKETATASIIQGTAVTTSAPASTWDQTEVASTLTATTATSTSAGWPVIETANPSGIAGSSALETSITSAETEGHSSESQTSGTSAWEATVTPTAITESSEALPSSTESAAFALPTNDADIPFCEEDGEGEWEEVWVDEEDVQPDWEVLE